MNAFRTTAIALVILCPVLTFPLYAQFGGRGGLNSGGPVATAGPAGSDRIITVGGRLTPYRKIYQDFSVDGFVDEILVTQGQRITEGTPLIRISRDVIGETFRPVILDSPMNGIVSEIHVYEKEQVSSGTAAVTIIDDRYYVLKASISDRDAPAVRKLGALAVEGMTPEGTSYRGTIRSLSTEPDYGTGLFTLTISFPRNRDLYFGTVLFVDLPVEKASGITIEETALIQNDQGFFVWIVDGDGLLEQRPITSGARSEGKVEILEGISQGERYVRKPSGKEEPGMSVRELIRSSMAENG